MEEITLNKLIFQVYEALEINSDDTTIDKRLVEDLIAQNREIWIRNSVSKGEYISEQLIQHICVPLELVSRYSCGCEELDSDCKILRSTLPLPTPLNLKNRSGVLGVRNADILSIAIKFMTYEEAIYFGNGRFNKDKVGAFIRDNYLYVFTNGNLPELILLEKVVVDILVSNPRVAAKYQDCDSKPCWTPDSKYPITLNLWQFHIKPYVVQELLHKKGSQEDNNNNSNDDAVFKTAPKVNKDED
jgi:hypothetical protein